MLLTKEDFDRILSQFRVYAINDFVNDFGDLIYDIIPTPDCEKFIRIDTQISNIHSIVMEVRERRTNSFLYELSRTKKSSGWDERLATRLSDAIAHISQEETVHSRQFFHVQEYDRM